MLQKRYSRFSITLLLVDFDGRWQIKRKKAVDPKHDKKRTDGRAGRQEQRTPVTGHRSTAN